jgi:hypothetical protein
LLVIQFTVLAFPGPAGIWGVRTLISVGDSLEEHEAAIRVARSCPCYVKALKFLERPSVSQLARQLELCASHLSEIATHAGNLDLNLGQVVAHSQSIAEGKDVVKSFLTSAKYGMPPGNWSNETMPMQKRRRLLSWAGQLGA